MSHKAEKQFSFSYHYAGDAWGGELWADDIDDARRKLRAMANGEVDGEAGLVIKVPNWFGSLIEWWRK